MNKRRSLEHRAVRLLTRLHLGRAKRDATLSAKERRDRRKTRWGWKGHIRGMGTGLKSSVDPTLDGLSCVTIYVRSKMPEHRIPKRERIPTYLHLSSLGAKVLTDVVELKGAIIAHAATHIQPGDEVAHEQGERGTLGLIVTKGSSAQPLALGCSHVLARSGIGAAEGDRVEHPLDVNSLPEVNCFGRLTADFVTLQQGKTAHEDFALAVVQVPFDIATGGTTPTAVVDSSVGIPAGTPTLLNGLKTQDAHGKVLNSNWSGTVNDVPFVGNVDFEELVSYQTRCLPGDSGAVVVQDGTSLVLGIHVGGSAEDNFGLFMPLGPVFERLGLTLAKKGGTA